MSYSLSPHSLSLSLSPTINTLTYFHTWLRCAVELCLCWLPLPHHIAAEIKGIAIHTCTVAERLSTRHLVWAMKILGVAVSSTAAKTLK